MMKDTRRTREIMVVAATAVAGAILGDFYLKPLLNRKLKVKA